MPRQKNDGKGRMGGRKAGTPNKTTSQIRDKIKDFLESKSGELEDIWNALEAKEKFQMFSQLSRYIIPTMQSTEFKIDETTSSVIKTQLDELSEEEK